MQSINHNVRDSRPVNSYGALLNELFQEKNSASGKGFTPAVDIYEEDNLYGVELAVPGIKKEDIKIDIMENKLHVSGERRVDGNNSPRKHFMKEIPLGTFSKTFLIPKDVLQDKIEAKYEEGILKLVLPKNRKLEHKYQIEIK